MGGGKGGADGGRVVDTAQIGIGAIALCNQGVILLYLLYDQRIELWCLQDRAGGELRCQVVGCLSVVIIAVIGATIVFLKSYLQKNR